MKYIYLLLAWCICFNIYSQANPCIALVDGKFYDPATNSQFISKGVNFKIDLHSYDNGVTFEAKVHHSYYPSNVSPCVGQTNCNADINNYMQYVKTTLGANTLRIPMMEAYLTGSANDKEGDCYSTSYTLRYADANNTTQYVTLTDLAPFAAYYVNILDIAQSNGLKVILLLSGKGGDCPNAAIKTIYDHYLMATAQACKDHPALLAYDIWNEPEFQRSVTGVYKKSDICLTSNAHYNLLKSIDPNHLITIGLWSTDAEMYSPDVFKADFFAYHLYPSYHQSSHEENLLDANGQPVIDASTGLPVKIVVMDANPDYNNTQLYIDGFNSQLKWVANNCNKPFLIGETGFRARRQVLPPYTTDDNRMDGDLAAQSQYVQQTLASTINSGGLGYIWWQAFDVSWNPPENPGGDDFGLIDPDYSSSSLIPKPAATTFLNFDQYQTTGPAVSYPANYTNILGNTGTALTGVVTNNFGEPVAEAVISGWHLQPNPDDITKVDWPYHTQTITQSNGTYLLNSVTPISVGGNSPDFNTTKINHLLGCAVFHNVLAFDNYYNNPNYTFPLSGHSIQLTKQQLTDVALNNQILFNGYPNTYSASNNLLFTNSFIDFAVPVGSGATAVPGIFTAGREIAITGESHASGPYDIEFYIDFNPDCSDNAYMRTAAPTAGSNKKSTTQNTGSANDTENNSTIKTIFLNYDHDALNTRAKVYPNPVSEGNVTIECEIGIVTCELYNTMGQPVFSRAMSSNIQKNTVNLSNLSNGIYTLHITLSNGNKSIHQLIIQ